MKISTNVRTRKERMGQNTSRTVKLRSIAMVQYEEINEDVGRVGGGLLE